MNRRQRIISILREARAKIARKQDWGQGRHGVERPAGTRCALEAIVASGAEFPTADLGDVFAKEAAENAVARAATGGDGLGVLSQFNDTHDHALVMRAFDDAIASR